MFALLAEIADPISGGAGWVGAGLLGSVLAWLLLKHLPDKDKQIEAIITKYMASEKEQREAYSAALDKVVEHCKEEMGIIVGHWVRKQ